jgi:hypothetical protein
VSEIWGNQVTVIRRNGAIRTHPLQAPGDSHLLAPFSGRTPVNGKIYPFKSIHVTVVDAPAELVVVTLLVYHH